MQWLKDTMNKFIAHFRNPQGKLTTEQATRLADEFGKIAKDLVDKNGEKIFRYNRRTHNIRLADGRGLNETLKSMDLDIAFSQRFSNNEDEISQRFFDKYLTDGIMKMKKDTIEKEIGEYADLSKMSDPVARDEARDNLPYIRKLLTWYNQKTVQNNPEFKNHFAARIEYARRCFDDDERIRAESAKQITGNERPRGEYTDSSKTLPGNVIGRNNSNSRQITRRLSRNVSGGKSDAWEHFLKLYDEIPRIE